MPLTIECELGDLELLVAPSDAELETEAHYHVPKNNYSESCHTAHCVTQAGCHTGNCHTSIAQGCTKVDF